MTIMSATGTASGTATVSGVARMKHSFSMQHLVAGRHFASLASQIQGKGKITEQDASELRAYVAGTVIFSVAFLEASINELYLEALDRNTATLNGLTAQQMAVLAELWETVEQHQLLGKYQIALAACGKSRLDKGAEPFQGTDGLVKMRNVLIHYRPEWNDELEEHKKVQDRLNGRFPLNPLANAGSLWFPDQCLGAGCAEWAIKQVVDFMREFCSHLGVRCRLP
jgi:hypothetical protein